MKRKRLNFEEDNFEVAADETSTIFGDIVSFMMSLFILLFSLSNHEKTKGDLAEEMRQQFGGNRTEAVQQMTTEALLVSQLEHFLQKEKLEKEAQILVDEQKIRVILHPPVLFESGSAVMNPAGFRVLKGISEIFQNVRNPIVIEGHTDDIPIHTTAYDSNWDLSFHRAYTVVKFFINDLHFSPKQFSATGYGEYRPLVENNSETNRAKNRRIELNIIRITKKK